MSKILDETVNALCEYEDAPICSKRLMDKTDLIMAIRCPQTARFHYNGKKYTWTPERAKFYWNGYKGGDARDVPILISRPMTEEERIEICKEIREILDRNQESINIVPIIAPMREEVNE